MKQNREEKLKHKEVYMAKDNKVREELSMIKHGKERTKQEH